MTAREYLFSLEQIGIKLGLEQCLNNDRIRA